MLTHGFWFLTCDALAVYRLSVLATKDTLTEPVREWLRRPWSMTPADGAAHTMRGYSGLRWRTFELLSCQWCVSIWLAAGVVALTRFAPDEWQYGAMFLALSGVAGFMGER